MATIAAHATAPDFTAIALVIMVIIEVVYIVGTVALVAEGSVRGILVKMLGLLLLLLL